MSGSLTSVEETLQKTQHQMESLSEGRLDKVSGIIEESGTSFAETMQDVPSMVSHLKQVHATQKIHEDRILDVLSKLEKYEAEGDHRKSVIETMLSEKVDHLVAHLQEGCREGGTDYNSVYITISYMQILWFVFGILFVSAIVCFLYLAQRGEKDAGDIAGYFLLAAGAFTVLLVILSLWVWFRLGFWILICVGVGFALFQLYKKFQIKKRN